MRPRQMCVFLLIVVEVWFARQLLNRYIQSAIVSGHYMQVSVGL